MSPDEAQRVAMIAHSARGQMRADRTTPYIVHPRRVAQLIYDMHGMYLREPNLFDRLVAAFLHDVLEDTKLSEQDLLDLGITPRQLQIVKLLTKPNDGPAPASYYENIAADKDALVVKCFDRCANLEDALADLLVDEPATPRRWAKYVEKTYRDVMPMYKLYPPLETELGRRLQAIEAALPAALERRALIVQRARTDAGIQKLKDHSAICADALDETKNGGSWLESERTRIRARHLARMNGALNAANERLSESYVTHWQTLDDILRITELPWFLRFNMRERIREIVLKSRKPKT